MPPKQKVTREEIVAAGLDVVRASGAAGLNARAVAARLGVSTQPIFSHYARMDDLRADVIAAAGALCQSFMNADMAAGAYPPYKATGLAYIRFAREERELFKLLFMRDRAHEDVGENREAVAPLLDLIQAKSGLARESAYRFHLEMWVYVHGLATMTATGYLNWTWEDMSQMLTDAFQGLLLHYSKRGEASGSH